MAKHPKSLFSFVGKCYKDVNVSNKSDKNEPISVFSIQGYLVWVIILLKDDYVFVWIFPDFFSLIFNFKTIKIIIHIFIDFQNILYVLRFKCCLLHERVLHPHSQIFRCFINKINHICIEWYLIYNLKLSFFSQTFKCRIWNW